MADEMIHSTGFYNTTSSSTTANWWNSLKASSSNFNDIGGSFPDAKSRTSAESPGSLSNVSCVTFQDSNNQVSDPMIDSTSPFMGYGGLPSPVTDWSQPVLATGAMLQEDIMSSRTFYSNVQQQDQQQLYRSNQNHMSTINIPSSNKLMMMDNMNNEYCSLQANVGSDLLLSPAASYAFQPSLFNHRRPMNNHPLVMNSHDGSCNYNQMQSPAVAARLPHQLLPTMKEPLQFTNDTPFWNPSTGSDNVADASSNLNPTIGNLTTKLKPTLEGVGDSSSFITKKMNAAPAFKKPRIETPSPLPTFKVRKEKLGDRITALQQLVSPFGKTDTASVLHETIEYIKFLHDQVGVLSAPYLKSGHQLQHLKSLAEKSKDSEAPKRDLRSRGLCLVPISSTFAVASEVPVDFFAPAFGASFR